MQILYEDNHLLVINKPCNLLSQGDASGDPDVLALMKRYLKNKYSKPGNVFLALVQRLDRPVSGLMVLARTTKAASRLSAQIRNQQVVKEYRAIVESAAKGSGKLIHYIGKDEKKKRAHVFPAEMPGSKKAELWYEVLETRNRMSLIHVKLKTGRFHQIRIQLSEAAMPVAGDAKYGASTRMEQGIALMCCRLSFRHPTGGHPLDFSLDLPDYAPWKSFHQPEKKSG